MHTLSETMCYFVYFQMQYFGLRYVTKKIQFRWVDLSKPLKKQLEKYAQTSHAARSPRLYFGVIFYIASAHKIIDDVARLVICTELQGVPKKITPNFSIA